MSSEENNNAPSEESFEDGFLGASVTVEDRSFGPQYPICQYVNGNAKNKKQGGIPFTGGFFISEDQGLSKEVLEKAGFEAVTLVTNDGTELVGYGAQSLTVSPIRYRRCWQVTGTGNSLARRFGWDEYDAAQNEGKPRGVAHVLCAIPGIDDTPVLISFRGMVARGVMGQGKERGVIPMYGQKIVAAANRMARAAHKKTQYPLCAFRLTIGSEMDGKNPVFTTVGSGDAKNTVTRPVWIDEPTGEVTSTVLNRLYVGNERFAAYQDWHTSADEWVVAWETEALQNFRNRRQKSSGASGDSGESDSGVPGENGVVF